MSSSAHSHNQQNNSQASKTSLKSTDNHSNHLQSTPTPIPSPTSSALSNRPGSSQLGKSAYDWDVFKNRKSALQYLRRHRFGIDTILETEDGSAYELVHSQVISAFGNQLNDYINQNGTFVDSYKTLRFDTSRQQINNSASFNSNQQQVAAYAEQPTTQLAISSPSTEKTVIHSPNSTKDYAAKISLTKQVPNGRWPGKIRLIRLPKLNKYTINILVDCAYTGYIRTDLPSGGIWHVLDMAEYYGMIEIIRACCAFLIKNLDKSNCVHFYHIGSRYRHPLQRCAWHKIRANFKYILAQNLQFQPNVQQTIACSNHAEQPSTMSNDNQTITQQSSSNQTNHQPAQAVQQIQQHHMNSIATIQFEHFEPLLMHDKLNIDNEECIWHAISLWCNHNLPDRASKVTALLPCMRFPRFKSGTDFSARHIWRDPLILQNKQAQQQLAILDRNHRDYLIGNAYHFATRDGFSLPCAPNPRQLRPRIPHSILLAIGGWQQGQPTTLIESYDSNCNLWFECKKRIMSPLAYHGIEYINGLLYICGGTDGTEILNEMFIFDPVRGDCAQKPSMRESRCYVSTAHLNGFLYAIGGHNGAQRMKSVERFDIVNEIWNHIQDMNVARSDASACVHNSLIYIAGGLNEQVIESSVEFYNPQDNTWTFLASMITPRTSFTLMLYNGALLAIGGNNGTERLASVEQYSFTTKHWSHHSNMRHRRSTFSAALMDETKLVVVGGYNGQTPFNQVEMYDERDRGWSVLQKIRYDRSGLKAIVINDLPNAADYTFLGHNSIGSGFAARNS